MSTRSEVLFKDRRNKIYFYHHSDGYYEGVGKNLVELIKKHESIGGEWFFTNELYQALAENDYELNDFFHDDLDYVYVVDMKEKTIIGMQALYTTFNSKLIDYEYLPGRDMIEMFKL